MTPTPYALGYAFALQLPRAEDARLRRWAEATPGGSWDESGAHVTLARLTGSLPPESLLPAFRAICDSTLPLEVTFDATLRGPYWDKPGLEIVMLVGETEAAVAGVLELRERILASMLPLGLTLFEGGPYQPHITLTTGVPAPDAERLEAAASGLEVRFTAHELMYWCGAEETPEGTLSAGPKWHIVEHGELRDTQ